MISTEMSTSNVSSLPHHPPIYAHPSDTQTSDATELHRTILMVEDDVELAQMLVEFMADTALDIVLAHDGLSALEKLSAHTFDLVILDVMLPGRSGFEVLQSLRQQSRVPVIMMTARTDHPDRIAGLEMGADDYVCKPVDPGELLARIRAVLRRFTAAPTAAAMEVASIGPLRVSSALLVATVHGEPLALTAAELRILEMLVRHAGTALSRERMTEEALGRTLEPFDRSLDTHVSNLRRKLRQVDCTDGLPEIRGLRSQGYMLTLGSTT